jgi:mannose-6-phosphate isomerase-like protein (cupin superfamily)
MTTEQVLSADPKAEWFSLSGTPVLLEGRYDEVLARCDGFATRVKVYFEGGENATHTHLNENHLFFVLAGEATFFLGRDGGEVKVARKYQGVLLPKGSYYRFNSSGEENLVMLRVGASDSEDRGRVGPNGLPLPGHSAENHHIDGVPVPGAFFHLD